MKGKRIKQINNLIIRYTDAYQYAVWTPDGICWEDRMTLEQAEDFCRRTKDYVVNKHTEPELNPCPACGGSIKIYTHIARGAFAKCQRCRKEYAICGMDQIPLYKGCRFSKATANKVRRMWNDHSKKITKKEN